MPQYYEEIERTGVEIEEVRNCTKNLAGNWNFSIVYRYKCPFCQHKYNMSPGTETFPEGVHTIKTKHQCTNSKCRKEYDVVLKLKSDFTELKNADKEKKKKQLEGYNKSSQQETPKPESSSNPDEQKPGLIKRLILLPFKMIYFMFVSREGNIASVVLTIFGIFMDYFFSNKADGLIGRIFVSLGLVAIYGIRSYKIYKESELKFHQQLSKDVIEGISGLFSIVSKAFIGE